MKKTTIFTAIALMFSVWSYAQIITSTPAFVTKDYNGEIEIIFDAAQGTAGLKDYTGTDGIYAHTGVITSESTSGSDWKHAPTWGDNSDKYKLTSLGNNKWKLLITPNIATYYGLNTGEVVEKLAFVFRNGLKTKEGKDTGGKDIYLTVYDAGLNVNFTNPASNKSVAVGTTENISIAASIEANLELLIDGASVKTASATKSLTYSHTFANSGDYQLVAKAVAGEQTKYDTVYVNVPTPVTNQARPSGYKDGITYSEDGTQATLIMYAPNKKNVFLIGDMTDWRQKNEYQLKKDGNYWWITLTGLTPGKLYGFQYLVDGVLRVTDAYTELVLDPWSDKWINEHHQIYPNIPAYPEGKTDGLVATLQSKKPAYNWEVTNFKIENPDNVVIYELLLRDFTPEKSLEAAIGKLDYLKDLGITAVELMPIQEFDGNDSWGYDPNHFFAPDKAYGSPEMYKKFIDECHKRGMAVIIDKVFNHATGLHPFAKLYWNDATNKTTTENPWFNVDAPHGFSVFHDFNHSFAGTKEHFKRVLQYWLTEYKVDGFRMDLTKGFTQKSGTENTFDQERVNNLNEYYNAVKEVNPNAMFILEHFVGGSEEPTLANAGMYIWRNVNNAFSQSAMGFQADSDFGGMNSLPRKWVGYAESHDEERNFYKAKAFGNGVIKTDSIVRIGRVPLNVAFTALTPGPKMIWQFGELGYDYAINSLGGRTAKKPSAFPLLDLPHRKEAYMKSAKAITLKKMFPKAFTEGNYSLQISGNDWANGRRVALTHADLNMVMVGNFQPSGTASTYPNFPKTGTWYELMSGDELNVTNTNMTLSINGGEVKIYTDRKVTINTSTDELSHAQELSIFPSVTDGKVWISTSSDVQSVVIYNVQGAIVRKYDQVQEVDASDFTSGLYLMEIQTNKGRKVERFVRK